MQVMARPRLRRASAFVLVAASAALLAACATPQPKGMVNTKSRSKEYFAESEYGVKASPRVTNARYGIKRGGGRDQLGKPYQVRGKWYYPKEDRKYSKVGSASWYGDAFHGRLTANGEIYDVSHLTAAHPTMPLPSYARVTNMANGSSVIVRVNDRGPYHDGRIIDLSKRAAEMLDYAHSGTARVKVDYVGRAPLDGHDDQYLMASYQTGNKPLDPSVGLPTGVMIAMNGATPSAAPGGAGAVPFPGQLSNSRGEAAFQPMLAAQAPAAGELTLPDFGPIAPERPDLGGRQPPFAVASLSYADERVGSAAQAFAAMERSAMSSSDIVASWKRANPGDARIDNTGEYVAVGTYEDAAQAERMANALSGIGKGVIDKSGTDGHAWYSVSLRPDGRRSIDAMLEAAWSSGAADALVVRD
ncbi:septal ring lytic transglycosylase RlpA family protein [Mesorhizobium sp. BE184]|uniref:septal ring lytic transglycosylase RlpA family protein n=1 Tax=Mesorhizobium sp. BE184 TaxID=2817714 RepID=UPI00285B4D10|nr:septal ring lytic transglycosylase RlpA family protein [Mesorhizobium sp. BE184]MDR7032571.1 rare lipoprotein A [Mesorhizobium sp. BE184]